MGPFNPREAEPAGRIAPGQGLPSGDKMDWVIEKAVELGAVRVVPVAAQRSVLQLTGPGWKRVATGNASPNRPASNAAAIAS